MRRNHLLLVGMLGCLLLPSAVAAEPPPLVPPGLSGADQYTETLPGPAGNERTEPPQGQSRKQRASALGESNARKLEAKGADGRAAAELAAGGPASQVPHQAGHRPGGAGDASAERPGGPGDGSSGLSQVLGNLTGTSDSGGMGLLLPALLVGAALAAGAFALGRARTDREPTSPSR